MQDKFQEYNPLIIIELLSDRQTYSTAINIVVYRVTGTIQAWNVVPHNLIACS